MTVIWRRCTWRTNCSPSRRHQWLPPLLVTALAHLNAIFRLSTSKMLHFNRTEDKFQMEKMGMHAIAIPLSCHISISYMVMYKGQVVLSCLWPIFDCGDVCSFATCSNFITSWNRGSRLVWEGNSWVLIASTWCAGVEVQRAWVLDELKAAGAPAQPVPSLLNL